MKECQTWKNSDGELKKIVKQGSTQSYIANPALLEHWNPGDMVIRHSPWTHYETGSEQGSF